MLWSSTKERATKAYPGKQLVRNTHDKKNVYQYIKLLFKIDIVSGFDILCSCPPFECTCSHVRMQYKETRVDNERANFPLCPSSYPPQIYEASPSPWQRPSGDCSYVQSAMHRQHNSEQTFPENDELPTLSSFTATFANTCTPRNMDSSYPRFEMYRGCDRGFSYTDTSNQRFASPVERYSRTTKSCYDTREFYNSSCLSERPKLYSSDSHSLKIKTENDDPDFGNIASISNQCALTNRTETESSRLLRDENCQEFSHLPEVESNSLYSMNDVTDSDIIQNFFSRMPSDQFDESSFIPTSLSQTSTGPKYIELKPLKKAKPDLHSLAISSSPQLFPHRSVHDVGSDGCSSGHIRPQPNCSTAFTDPYYHNDTHQHYPNKQPCNHSINITLTYN